MPSASPEPDPRVALGLAGEDLACRELERLGYAILARRVRTRRGELDIVAEDRGTVVFVEVKARRSERYGSPAEAVSWTKRRTIEAQAIRFLHERGWLGRPCRFDVVSVRWPKGGEPLVEVVRGAFDGCGW